jgi:hypothetical protein
MTWNRIRIRMDPYSYSKLDLDPHSLKKLDPDPHKVNADPNKLVARVRYLMAVLLLRLLNLHHHPLLLTTPPR